MAFHGLSRAARVAADHTNAVGVPGALRLLALAAPLLCNVACSPRAAGGTDQGITFVRAAGTLTPADGPAPTTVSAVMEAGAPLPTGVAAAAPDEPMISDSDGVQISAKKRDDPYRLSDVDFSQI